MSGASHLLLPFKRTNRYAGRFTFLMMAGLAGSFYWVFSYEIERETLFPLFGTFLLAMLAGEAVPLLRPRLRAGDGLRLSAEGLAFSRGGRTVHWRWDEISDLRMRSRLHPAALFLGRFMTFRVPSDGRRADIGFRTDRIFLRGAVVAIGDDYANSREDIRDQIENYRAAAGAGMRRQARNVAPETVWSFRKDRRQPKFWHIAGLVLGPAFGIGVGSLIVDGLPDSLDLLESLDSMRSTFLGVLLMAPWFVVMLLKQETAQDNMLSLDAGGLNVRHRQDRRHWRWSEIQDLEVSESVSRGKDGAAARIINIRASHDGSDLDRAQKDEKPVTVSCSIEDDYVDPLEEIARQAHRWLEWSGRTSEKAQVKSTEESEIRASDPSEAISFRRPPGQMKDRHSLLEGLLPWAGLAPMAIAAGWSIWALKSGGGLWAPWWVMMIGFLLIVLVPVITMAVLAAPPLNRLDLTEESLEMTRLGRTSRWAWSEIGSANLRRVRTKWSAKQRTVLTVGIPAARWGSRYLRWAHNLDSAELFAVIEDTYDTPLDQIAETLNAHRRKYGGRAARRPAEKARFRPE